MTGRVMFLCDGDISQMNSFDKHTCLLTFKSLLNPANPGIIEEREDAVDYSTGFGQITTRLLCSIIA